MPIDHSLDAPAPKLHRLRGKYPRVAFLSDIHAPFEDQAAMQAVFRILDDYRPDLTIIGGDAVDFYGASDHVKDPDRQETLQEEFDLANARVFKPIDRLSAKVIYLPGNHECFSEDTEILTDAGWRPFGELTQDHKVAMYDSEDGQIKFALPQAVHKYPYEGDMVSVQSHAWDLLITPNHRLVYRSTGARSFKLDEIQNITLGDIVVPVSGRGLTQDLGLTDDEIRLGAWLCTDARVVGSQRIIYQRQSNSAKIEDLLDRLNVFYTKRVRSNDRTTHICGRRLLSVPEPSVEFYILSASADLVDKLVKENQQLPPWVFGLSKRQFDIFLDIFVEADGSRHVSAPDTSWMAYGKERILTELQLACFFNGYRTSLVEYRPCQFRLNIAERASHRICNFQERKVLVPYSGWVWCVTTPLDTVVVRRNGKIAITGNSRLFRTIRREPSLFNLRALSLKKAMELPDSWDVYANQTHLRLGHLLFLHGDLAGRSGGARNIAANMLEKMRTNCIFGHHHRVQHVIKTDYEGKFTGAWANGHLCDVSQARYIANPDWQQSISLVEYSENMKYFQVYQVIIHQGVAVW